MEFDKHARIQYLEWQIKQMSKTSDEEFWYYRFDRYMEEMQFATILKYDPRTQAWYKYYDGVYHQIEVDEINTLIYDWGALVNEKLNNMKMTFLLKRIRANCLFKGRWDPDPNIDNCLNGLVDKTTRQIKDHTPEYPSLEQIQRNYMESDGVIPPLFHKLLQVIADEDERNWFIQMLINIVHKYFDDEVFCILYGPKGGGKSTILQLPEQIFGQQNVSKTPLQKIGKRFGLKELYNKRINVNPDLPIMPMDDSTIALLKQLTGNDGTIEVELKGRDSFIYEVKCFLLFGINQLMGFKATSEKEIESIFRRCLLINLPKTLDRDVKFKKSLCDSRFLDELYSWLVWMRPLPIVGDEIDWWVDIQKEKWLTNANPILTICNELFTNTKGWDMPVRTVVELVRTNLEEGSILTPQQLQTNVSQALQTMRIYRDAGRGANAKYIDIKLR